MFVVVFLLTRISEQGGIYVIQFFKRGLTPIIGSLLVIGFVTTNYNFVTLYRTPYLEKQSFISQQVAGCSKEALSHQITIVKRSIPWEKKNVIGAYSQHTDLESEWVPIGAVYYYLKDIGSTPNALPLFGQEKAGKSGCFITLDKYPRP